MLVITERTLDMMVLHITYSKHHMSVIFFAKNDFAVSAINWQIHKKTNLRGLIKNNKGI